MKSQHSRIWLGTRPGVPSVGIHDNGVHHGVHPGAVRTLVGGENPSSVRESSITARGTSPELHQSMSVDSCISGEEAKPFFIRYYLPPAQESRGIGMG